MKENKFFKNNDEKLEVLGTFKIPKSWWSRSYEYYFASQYLEKNDIIIDAGCGIEHPFKWWAKDKVKMVHAVDIDERICEFQGEPGINYWKIALTDIDKHIKNVDKVFCISVFEHLEPKIQIEVIKTFYNVLKPGGKLIMTIDYPLVQPTNLLNMFDKNWEINKTYYKESNNDIYSSVYHLKCYSLVARKKELKKKEAEK